MNIFLSKRPWSDRVEFLLREQQGDRHVVGEQVLLRTLTPADDGVVLPGTFALQDTVCQALVDQLWNLGFRPSEGSGSAGALAATQAHLADMRTIAFRCMEIPPQANHE